MTLAFATACVAGSGPIPEGYGGTSTSRLNQSKRFTTLSQPERAEMCDWVASLYGGYGQSKAPATCEKNVTISKKAPRDQAECVKQLDFLPQTCEATVGEVEDCLVAIDANPCAMMGKDPPAACRWAMPGNGCSVTTTTTTVSEVDSSPPSR